MTFINWWIRPLGIILVPCPPSVQQLEEHANVSEAHHPSRGGNTVKWMRQVASMMTKAGHSYYGD
jgi:hypothetical protein